MSGTDEKLAALTTMSSAQLKEEWRRLTGIPLPRASANCDKIAASKAKCMWMCGTPPLG